MSFQNAPKLTSHNAPDGMRIQHKHQPLTIEHFGIHAKITENGKVIITKVAEEQSAGSDSIEFDEIEIPASLVFKLASLLKDTRTSTFVPISAVESKQADGKDSTNGESK